MLNREPPHGARFRFPDIVSPVPAVILRPGRRILLATGAMIALLPVGACVSSTPVNENIDLEAARSRLGRPLTADPAALYRLRVPASGGLRMAVMAHGDDGRLTVSEPFGSAVSLTAWRGAQPPTFFDLREGCRLEAANLEQALGVAAMPLPQAVRLLCGRLPATADDEVSERSDGRLLISGRGWTALVTVKPDPWRVVAVEDGSSGAAGWRISVGDHTASVGGSAPIPKMIRVQKTGGRWAELELVRLEWSPSVTLPPLPDHPLCVFEE